MAVSGSGKMGYIGKRKSPPPSVTQITDATTAVVLNGSFGVIVGITQTLAADAMISFTLTNSYIQAGSVVLVNVVGYSGTYNGTAGFPVVSVGTVANGSCLIQLFNPDAASLVGIVTFAFQVIR